METMSKNRETCKELTKKKHFEEICDGLCFVTEKDGILVTGNISKLENGNHTFTNIDDLFDNDDDIDGVPLLEKDIYKELKLRGYNYTGAFRGLRQCNNLATKGVLKWDGNWIAFLDNMLQINILQVDTRNLYVPTGIRKLLINSKDFENGVGSDGTVEVRCLREAYTTSCRGVEITGYDINQISKSKFVAEPVLEAYQFVPNEGSLDLERCLRVNVQIILENVQNTAFRVIEILDDLINDKEPLCRLIQKALADQPLIQPDIKLLTDKLLSIPGVVTKNESLGSSDNCVLVAAVDILTNTRLLTEAMNVTREDGYILSRQDVTFRPEEYHSNFLELVTCYRTELETVVLLRKREHRKASVLNVRDSLRDITWVTELQQRLAKMNGDVVVVSQHIQCSGILGFFNCLRREPGGARVRCALLMDDVSKFDPEEEFYEKQLKKGLAVNILKNGRWGTYRHLLLRPLGVREAESSFVSVINAGDLSSLTWIEGPLTSTSIVEKGCILVHVSRITMALAYKRRLSCVPN